MNKEIIIESGDFGKIFTYLQDGYKVGDVKETFYYFMEGKDVYFHNKVLGNIKCEYIHFDNMPYKAYKGNKKWKDMICDDIIRCKECPLYWVCNITMDNPNNTSKTLQEIFEGLKITNVSIASVFKNELEKEVED